MPTGRLQARWLGRGSGLDRLGALISIVVGVSGPLLVLGGHGVWLSMAVLVVGPLAVRRPELVMAISFAILYVTTALSRSPLSAFLAFTVGVLYVASGVPGRPSDAAKMLLMAALFWLPVYILVSAWSQVVVPAAARGLGLLLGAQRALIVVSAFYAAVFAYSVLHPRPGLPSPVAAWRRIAASRLLPFRLVYYGLGVYASLIEPPVLIILMVALGVCLAVRLFSGRDELGLLASVIVFAGLLYLSGLIDNFEAYIAATP